jgi:hypothetical protein
MGRGRSLFWLPLLLVWTVVKATALPAVVALAAWWLLPDRVASVVTGIAVVYLLVLAVFAGAQLRGQVRSMARGSFTIHDKTRSRRWHR